MFITMQQVIADGAATQLRRESLEQQLALQQN